MNKVYIEQVSSNTYELISGHTCLADIILKKANSIDELIIEMVYSTSIEYTLVENCAYSVIKGFSTLADIEITKSSEIEEVKLAIINCQFDKQHFEVKKCENGLIQLTSDFRMSTDSVLASITLFSLDYGIVDAKCKFLIGYNSYHASISIDTIDGEIKINLEREAEINDLISICEFTKKEQIMKLANIYVKKVIATRNL